MLRILGRSSSINVRKVLWTCFELDLPYQQEQWGAGSLATSLPEFKALNPNGLVPVIRDGTFVLWESNAICRYLASRHQRGDLLPTGLERRAQVEQWMDWQATELNNAWRYAFMALVRHSPEHRDRAAIEASVQAWNRHMSVVEAQLQTTGAFITGGSFTLADIVLGLSLNRWLLTPLERPNLPCVAAYHDRLSAREGFMIHGRNGTP